MLPLDRYQKPPGYDAMIARDKEKEDKKKREQVRVTSQVHYGYDS